MLTGSVCEYQVCICHFMDTVDVHHVQCTSSKDMAALTRKSL